eukprot:gene7029-11194_t
MEVQKFSNEFGQEILIQKGNPYSEKVDVILNGTNKHLAFRGTEMIKQTGDDIQKEAQTIVSKNGPLKVGEFAKTSAGQLKTCKYIMHVVCIRWVNGKKGEEEKLKDSINTCLDEIHKLKLSSVTITCFPSMIFAYPKDIAVKLLWNTLINWLESHKKDTTIKRVNFISEDEEILNQFSLQYQNKRGIKRKTDKEEEEKTNTIKESKKQRIASPKKISSTMEDGMTLTQVDDGMTLTQVEENLDFPTKNYTFTEIKKPNSFEFKKVSVITEEDSQPIFKLTKNTQMDE